MLQGLFYAGQVEATVRWKSSSIDDSEVDFVIRDLSHEDIGRLRYFDERDDHNDRGMRKSNKSAMEKSEKSGKEIEGIIFSGIKLSTNDNHKLGVTHQRTGYHRGTRVQNENDAPRWFALADYTAEGNGDDMNVRL